MHFALRLLFAQRATHRAGLIIIRSDCDFKHLASDLKPINY